MIPYWQSKLSVTAAQRYSEDGIAVFGNPAMKDVIWPTDSEVPLVWIGKGYKPADPLKFRNRIGWVPSRPNAEYLANESVIYSCESWPDQAGKELVLKNNEWIEKVPKPVNTKKWVLDREKGVYRYEKNGNWAEVSSSLNPDIKYIPTRLCIKGKLIEFIDGGWRERENSMDYCEWQVEHPEGPGLHGWSLYWRLGVLALLIAICIWQPLYSLLGYCLLSYIIITIGVIIGEFGEREDPWYWRLILAIPFLIFAPIAFAFFIVYSAIRHPIL